VVDNSLSWSRIWTISYQICVYSN